MYQHFYFLILISQPKHYTSGEADISEHNFFNRAYIAEAHISEHISLLGPLYQSMHLNIDLTSFQESTTSEALSHNYIFS